MLLEEIFASEGAITDVLVETSLDAVDFEVIQIVYHVSAEDTLQPFCRVAVEHAYPLDVCMSMHAKLVSFPPIDVLERLATARGTLVNNLDTSSVVATPVGR